MVETPSTIKFDMTNFQNETPQNRASFCSKVQFRFQTKLFSIPQLYPIAWAQPAGTWTETSKLKTTISTSVLNIPIKLNFKKVRNLTTPSLEKMPRRKPFPHCLCVGSTHFHTRYSRIEDHKDEYCRTKNASG